MPIMIGSWALLMRSLLAWLVATALCISLGVSLQKPLWAEAHPPALSSPLETLAHDFLEWRAQYQPFSKDDIPRIERPLERTSGPRDWSNASIVNQKAALQDFERRWKQIDRKGWSIAEQVDYRLMGSALARVRWELDVNPRWRRDPSFYLDQTLTALLEVLVQPPPFERQRSREIVDRMEEIPKIIQDGKANLKAVRPFAEKAIVALESYRTWLQTQLNTMPESAAVGRENYEFFLHRVALLPFSPEQLLSISRQEW